MDILGLITTAGPIVLHVLSVVINFIVYMKTGQIQQQIQQPAAPAQTQSKGN